MNIRNTLLSGIFATSLAFGGSAALAQDSTPAADGPSDAEATAVASPEALEQLPVINAEGDIVAHVNVWEDEEGGGVWFSITPEGETGLEEGKHGVHVHEMGVCDNEIDPPFDSAGGHFNPTDHQHGDLNADPSHAGDLGNLEADADGNFTHEVLAEGLTLQSGEPNSLMDEDGSALIIHAGEDDLETDPSGDSGDRWGCAVIYAAPEEHEEPAATPDENEATPDATAEG